MSGIYIPGMESPDDCLHCPCADLEYMDCNLMPGSGIGYKKRLDDCPLIPVPEHGRLGDLDELFKRMFIGPDGQCYPDKDVDGWDHAYTFRGIKHEILSAPTVIPADPADKEGEG